MDGNCLLLFDRTDNQANQCAHALILYPLGVPERQIRYQTIPDKYCFRYAEVSPWINYGWGRRRIESVSILLPWLEVNIGLKLTTEERQWRVHMNRPLTLFIAIAALAPSLAIGDVFPSPEDWQGLRDELGRVDPDYRRYFPPPDQKWGNRLQGVPDPCYEFPWLPACQREGFEGRVPGREPPIPDLPKPDSPFQIR